MGLWYDYAMNKTTNSFQQLAIIGATASGKTSLAIKIAKQRNAYVLSLDSLSIYKEIDIVSAKPTVAEREGIRHFGIDVIAPNEDFDVTTFIKLYHDVYKRCLKDGKNLVIVGGTVFYLKMLSEGISTLPTITQKSKDEASTLLLNVKAAHDFLYQKDSNYMGHIETSDRYRIEKALHIYFETS